MSELASHWGKDRYVHSPSYDWTWIILAPLWAIAFGYLMTHWLFQTTVSALNSSESGAYFAYMTLIQAHLLIAAFRAHVNNRILDRLFWQLTLVPILLFFFAISSAWAFALLFVVMVF